MEIVAELGGLVNVGAGAILVFVVWMILTGRLLSRSTHEKITGLLQATIDEQKLQIKTHNESVVPAITRVLDALPVKPEPPGKG